jgi:hypothetical protein
MRTWLGLAGLLALAVLMLFALGDAWVLAGLMSVFVGVASGLLREMYADDEFIRIQVGKRRKPQEIVTQAKDIRKAA